MRTTYAVLKTMLEGSKHTSKSGNALTGSGSAGSFISCGFSFHVVARSSTSSTTTYFGVCFPSWSISSFTLARTTPLLGTRVPLARCLNVTRSPICYARVMTRSNEIFNRYGGSWPSPLAVAVISHWITRSLANTAEISCHLP